MERSNMRIVTFIMWWAQPKLYVGRGMHEEMFALFKYTFFWVMLLLSKLAFSYYVEILPLVKPTRLIWDMTGVNYQWHEFFPNATHNIGVIISIWGPIVLVYFMDTQIWYAIFSTLFGGISGAFSHLGEIRTLGMLRSRFRFVPSAFCGKLTPLPPGHPKRKHLEETVDERDIARFSQMWNKFVYTMRDEDLISDRYTFFWVMLLLSKLAFSYYVEILPLVKPTRLIWDMTGVNYQWHEFFPNATHNIGVIISIWGPIVLVYFMDTQIWYAIFSTLFGGISGAFSHLGEIRTLGMLRSRFRFVPSAFCGKLTPLPPGHPKRKHLEETVDERDIARFSQMWNKFVYTMRDEDLISDSRRIENLTAEMEELREAEANARRKMSEMEREIDKSDDERKVLEAIAARVSELETEVASKASA
ncbi:hypothetical protein F2Q70_00042034 [Brassica cretica]|uniref:Uncharacterized protein n=1 Tax=Brassica cretica TaxID=69181 RepID=A0A8S9K9D7_BRACR|nr:hypothetical protein F2Q70_00042034 [Brassica cretica]